MAHSPMQSRCVPSPSVACDAKIILVAGFQCIKVNPTWAKGYARKGAALHGQRNYVEAIEAYELGLKIEDSPALRKGLDEVKAAKGACLPSPPLAHFSSNARSRAFTVIQRQTSAVTEQRRWALEKCSVTRPCLPNSPPIHVPPSTSPT